MDSVGCLWNAYKIRIQELCNFDNIKAVSPIYGSNNDTEDLVIASNKVSRVDEKQALITTNIDTGPDITDRNQKGILELGWNKSGSLSPSVVADSIGSSIGTDFVAETPYVSIISEKKNPMKARKGIENAEGDMVVDDLIEDSDCEEAVNTEVMEETQWGKMVEMANSMEVVGRASQMEGINLMVDLRPASVRRRIIRQFFVECLSNQKRDDMDDSESLETQKILDVEKEFQEIITTGNRT